MEVTNRFKGLDLIDRVPEELWTEVHNIVQEALTKTVPRKINARIQVLTAKISREERKPGGRKSLKGPPLRNE